MARVADHLSVEDLEARLRSAQDPTATRHFQVIWLLARGHTIADVAAVTSFGRRWIEQLLARYNAAGPEALGDLRRRNGGVPSVLRPALLERLRARLTQPPPDGGLWSSRKVAAWMAGELGLAAVLPQRGWEALKAIGWSVQKPRPRHPASATPEEREAFKKNGHGCRRGGGEAPGKAGRGLGDRRAPHRAEADHPPGLGPQRPAADRARSPPLQVVVRDRLRAADLRRDLLVRVERGLQAVLCGAAGLVCPRGRGGTGSHDRARARQRRLAHRTEPGRARWDPARLLAPGLPRAAAGRAPVACPRRAARKPVLRDPRRSRTRRRRALPRSRWRSAQPRYKLPLVAQADQAELISRISYDTEETAQIAMMLGVIPFVGEHRPDARHDRVSSQEEPLEDQRVVDVGRGRHTRNRHTVSIHRNIVFRAPLGPVGRVGSREGPCALGAHRATIQDQVGMA